MDFEKQMTKSLLKFWRLKCQPGRKSQTKMSAWCQLGRGPKWGKIGVG